jgi:hypothetical protein
MYEMNAPSPLTVPNPLSGKHATVPVTRSRTQVLMLRGASCLNTIPNATKRPSSLSDTWRFVNGSAAV